MSRSFFLQKQSQQSADTDLIATIKKEEEEGKDTHFHLAFMTANLLPLLNEYPEVHLHPATHQETQL